MTELPLRRFLRNGFKGGKFGLKFGDARVALRQRHGDVGRVDFLWYFWPRLQQHGEHVDILQKTLVDLA